MTTGEIYRNGTAERQAAVEELTKRWARQEAQLAPKIEAALPAPLAKLLGQHRKLLATAQEKGDRDPSGYLDALHAITSLFEQSIAPRLPAARRALWQVPPGPVSAAPGGRWTTGTAWTSCTFAERNNSPYEAATHQVEEMLRELAAEPLFTYGMEADAQQQPSRRCLRAVIRPASHTVGLTFWFGGPYADPHDAFPTEVWADTHVAPGLPDVRAVPRTLSRRTLRMLHLEGDGLIGDPPFENTYRIDADDRTAKWLFTGRVYKGLFLLAVRKPAWLTIERGFALLHWPARPTRRALAAICDVLIGLREVQTKDG